MLSQFFFLKTKSLMRKLIEIRVPSLFFLIWGLL